MFEDISHEVVVASAGKRSIQLFVQSFTKSLVTVTNNNNGIHIQLTSIKQAGFALGRRKRSAFSMATEVGLTHQNYYLTHHI